MQKYNENLPVGSPRFDFYDFIETNRLLNISTDSVHGVGTVSTVAKDVWGEATNVTLLSSAETINIVSTNANDTFGGTGLNVLVIFGLDAEGYEQSEIVLMNGTTNVQTSLSFFRVNDIIGISAGSLAKNQGIIRATSSTTATVTAHMGIGDNRSRQAHYTVPNGKYFFLRWALVGATAAGKSIKATLQYEPFGSVRLPIVETFISATCVELTNNVAGIFPPLSTIYVQANTENGTASFSTTYNGYLIPSEYVL